jgi:predicted metal-dependent hydrolase
MTSPTPVRSRHALMWGSQRIAYELTVEDRSDLAITVQPDLRVIVRAPTRKSVEIIEQRIHARGSWIARQLRAFEQYHPLAVQRRFVSGETHWYLGRQYRLRVIDGPQSVRWPAGRLVVAVPRPELVCSVEKALQAWYDMRARVVFAERLAECNDRHVDFASLLRDSVCNGWKSGGAAARQGGPSHLTPNSCEPRKHALTMSSCTNSVTL